MARERLTKIAEGREAEIFAWDSATVLKLYRSGDWSHHAEQTALAILSKDGIAPALLGTVEIEGRPGILMERLDGIDMLALLERRPWRLFAHARSLAETQARIHDTQASLELPEARGLLGDRIRRAAALAPTLRDAALRELDTLPDGDRLCHGDFHPGNVLFSRDRAAVIDWSSASRGDPIGDHARTALLMKLGDPPPGSSRFFRTLVLVGRGLFASAYARAYLRSRPASAAARRSWGIVHAAARFAEGIEVEFGSLKRFLETALSDDTTDR
jgi:aminoglycoside phosphotransferase (APT) family kinase protein